MKKIKIFNLLMVMLVLLMPIQVLASDLDKIPSFSEDANDLTDDQKDTITEGDYDFNTSESEQVITQLFNNDLANNTKATNTALRMAQPFTFVTFVVTMFFVIIVCHMYLGVTAVDLAYIIVPPYRGLLYKRKEASGGFGGQKSEGGFMCISDACVQAVHGSEGGSMGGGSMMGGYGGGYNTNSQNGFTSSLMTYAKLRSKEFIIFALFLLLLIGGVLPRLVVMLWRLFEVFFVGILNMM